MNKKQYNNVIDWTVKHEPAAQTEDSLATARAVFNNMGVALPNGTMEEVYEIIKTNEYMNWRFCTMQEAQAAADKGTAAIGISKDRIVVLSATSKEQQEDLTMLETLEVQNTARALPDFLEYYTYDLTAGKIPVKKVSVISCFPDAWMESSAVMGQNMASAMGCAGNYHVLRPVDPDEFAACWESADRCVIVHTHGSADALLNESATEASRVIISTEEIKELPRNNNIQFVMMTACSTASGNANDNVAYWLSKKINGNGIVVANKYSVVGGNTSFVGQQDGVEKDGWVVYRNGVIEKLPKSLTMQKSYDIYRLFTQA